MHFNVSVLFHRLWSCDSIISRRQVILHALRPFRYTFNPGVIDCVGRPVDDTHYKVLALPQQPPRTFVPAVHHPSGTFWQYTWHADISISVATRGDIHICGTRVELHGFLVLLFHITHHHWSWWLHSRWRARPKIQAAI